MCIPDTNALLHYTRFDRLPWAERVHAALVRLIIPIAVIDELDAKKYARREEFQQRARELLTLIDTCVTASPPDGYSHLSQDVTVEVLPEEAGHLRAVTNDQEILGRCELLYQATGKPVLCNRWLMTPRALTRRSGQPCRDGRGGEGSLRSGCSVRKGAPTAMCRMLDGASRHFRGPQSARYTFSAVNHGLPVV